MFIIFAKLGKINKTTPPSYQISDNKKTCKSQKTNLITVNL